MASFRIVTLGDSIPWGQGLLEGEKYDAMVRDALGPTHPEGVSLERLAHSGAVIGAFGASGSPQPGEVPSSRPTIIEQCDAFSNSPEAVDLVLMDGGINDVGVATILNPLALIPSLAARTNRACYDGMLVLLQKVRVKFSKPSCRILVTGYYTIVSPRSDPLGVIKLLSMHGIAIPEFVDVEDDFIGPVIDRCEQFFADSTARLQQAIADANDARIRFVATGFTDDNAIFVPDTSLLWGLDLGSNLGPQDPVADQRRPLCDVAHSGPLQLPAREQCYRASAGHPNVAGAIRFKDQVMAALA
jgi:hypothetical protein